jgi:hypothetical protein
LMEDIQRWRYSDGRRKVRRAWALGYRAWDR